MLIYIYIYIYMLPERQVGGSRAVSAEGPHGKGSPKRSASSQTRVSQ